MPFDTGGRVWYTWAVGLGGWLGARLTLAGGERVVRWAVIVAITGMIVKLIWFP